MADIEFPDVVQAATLIRDMLATGDVATLLPFLKAEVTVWSADGARLLAGRVDAVIMREGRVLGVLDGKSDINPSRLSTARGMVPVPRGHASEFVFALLSVPHRPK